MPTNAEINSAITNKLKSGVWRLIVESGAIVFAVSLVMTVLGWRFTGNSTDIAQINTDVSAIKVTQAAQSLEIASLRRTSDATLFMECAMYKKIYESAPTQLECVRLAAEDAAAAKATGERRP